MDIGTISLVLLLGLFFLLAIGMPLGLASAILAVLVLVMKFEPALLSNPLSFGCPDWYTEETKKGGKGGACEWEHLLAKIIFCFLNLFANLSSFRSTNKMVNVRVTFWLFLINFCLFWELFGNF